MRLAREPALNTPCAWTLSVRSIAGDDVGAAAEIVTRSGDHDDPHGLVATGGIDRLDEGGHHRVVDGIALVRTVQREGEDALGLLGQHRLNRVRAHRSSNRSLIADSAPARSAP
jgi:hypothetical protein